MIGEYQNKPIIYLYNIRFRGSLFKYYILMKITYIQIRIF